MRKRDLIIEFLQLMTGIGLKKGKKAAPRFELGIKDLQSSALPLGHAAENNKSLPPDSISHNANSLLVLSNGHGEDQIALRVLEELHELRPNLSLEILPLVGEGKAFDGAIAAGWLSINGPIGKLPSGGFSNQSFRGFLADLVHGLLLLTWRHWRYVTLVASKKHAILAIGDILPLLLAWFSGRPFVFIGTPKSDYTWRSGPGRSLSDCYHRLKGSEWDLWEFALMRSSRCKMVAVRDSLTARGLKTNGVFALAPGNPMMDGFQKQSCPVSIQKFPRVILLCGSRIPEAINNFQRLLSAVDQLALKDPLVVLVALGGEPTCDELGKYLTSFGYSLIDSPCEELGAQACWIKGLKKLFIGAGQFGYWASLAEVGLATAGTATEQLVGLGIPVLSFPGEGPQFNGPFAKRQSRLLGGAVIPCFSSEVMAERLQLLLKDEVFRSHVASLGARRMGRPGGSVALASIVSTRLFG